MHSFKWPFFVIFNKSSTCLFQPLNADHAWCYIICKRPLITDKHTHTNGWTVIWNWLYLPVSLSYTVKFSFRKWESGCTLWANWKWSGSWCKYRKVFEYIVFNMLRYSNEGTCTVRVDYTSHLMGKSWVLAMFLRSLSDEIHEAELIWIIFMVIFAILVESKQVWVAKRQKLSKCKCDYSELCSCLWKTTSAY